MIPRKTIFAGFAPPSDWHWRILEECDADRVIFGIDDEDDDRRGADPTDYDDRWRLRPQWRGGKLRAAVGRAHNMGLSVGVHYWIRPVRAWNEGAHHFLRRLHADVHLDFVMGDAERHALKLDPRRGGYPGGWGDVLDHLGEDWATGDDVVFPGWPVYGVALYGLPTARGLALAHREWCREVCLMVYDAEVDLYLRCVERWREEGLLGKLTMGYGTYGDAPRNLEEAHAAVAAAGVPQLAIWQLRSTNRREARRIAKL